MKILALTDLHDRSSASLIGIQNIDLVLILGDITTGRGLEETKSRIEPLLESYPKVYSIYGNWERPESTAWLSEQGLCIDGLAVRHEKLLLFGLGGSIPTPFNTPTEFTEEHFEKLLLNCPEPLKDEHLVIVSHNPPYGACDRTVLGQHVGSRALRSFINEKSPSLVLCGHIHEARGVENLGSTVVINPGQAPHHYAIITIDGDISVNLN